MLFALALIARLVHIWQIRGAPFFTLPMGDSKSYDTWAQQIAAGDWLGGDVFYQAPLYPYFLGAIYTVFGHNLLVVRICQAVLGSLGSVLLAHAAWRLFSRRTAIIAGVLLALYPPAIFFDGLLQKTALDAFLTCLTLWVISGIIVRPSGWRTWVALGVVMGALSLTRENALALVGVLLLWSLLPRKSYAAHYTGQHALRSAGTNTSGGMRRVSHAAAFVLGLTLLLLPVALRNYSVGGGFYLTTSQFGPNLYLGNNARTDGTAGSLIAGRGSPEYERQDAVDIAERASGRPLTPGEVSSYWTGRTLEFIRSQPTDWLRLMARKVALLWNAAEAFDTESQESYSEWSTLLYVLGPIGHFGVLVPLAFIGSWVTWGDRRRLAVLYVVMLVYSASVIIFFIYARYRYPLVPFLLLFAAAGLSNAWSFAKTRSIRERGIVLAVCTLLAVFTNWPLLSASDMRAVTEHNLGAALHGERRLDEAITHYQRAVAINPDYAPAYSNMGAALLASGRGTDAVAAYERALAIEPDFPDAHFNLGNALLEQGQAPAAIAHFQRVLQSTPDAVDARTNLGIALMASGRSAEALAQLRAAEQRAPASPQTQRALGEALAQSGRRADAVVHLERAVALAPGDSEAHYVLGRFLLEDQRNAEAIDHLQTAVGLDPARVEAYNDIGIALASTGRFDEAIDQFTRALRQRPDFAEARRNLSMVTADRQRRQQTGR